MYIAPSSEGKLFEMPDWAVTMIPSPIEMCPTMPD